MTITDPHTQTAAGDAELFYYLHGELLPADDNLRGAFTDVSELADSIAESGLLQPLSISFEAGRPRIVAGNRRHAAIGTLIADGRWPAGRRISCFFAGDLDDDARTVAMLVENLQRVDLDPVEEARGYQRLKEAGWKPARIAARTGRPVDRVNGRLKLLKLPDKALSWISDGTMPLERVAQLVAAPEAVAKGLCAKAANTPPSEWQIADAVRTWERTQTDKTGRAFAADHKLEYSTKARWQLLSTFDEVARCRYDRTAGVLVPDGATLVSTEDQQLIIWQPRDTGQKAKGKKKAKTPLEVWQDECSRLRDEYHNALDAWGTRRDELMRQFAAEQRTKDVAASALWYTVGFDLGTSLDVAKQARWFTPPTDPDTEMDAFLAWLNVPANLTKCAALAILDGYTDEPSKLEKTWTEFATTELGDKPTLNLPPRPDATDLDDDQDDGEDEEGDDDE